MTKEKRARSPGQEEEEESQPASKFRKIYSNVETELSDHLSDALSSGKFSDVTLKTSTASFKLHKLILSRSPYFDSIFCGKWSESKNLNEVDIREVEEAVPGADSDTLRIMFSYFYTDSFEEVTAQNYKTIMQLADFFQLPAATEAIVASFEGDSLMQLIVMHQMDEHFFDTTRRDEEDEEEDSEEDDGEEQPAAEKKTDRSASNAKEQKRFSSTDQKRFTMILGAVHDILSLYHGDWYDEPPGDNEETTYSQCSMTFLKDFVQCKWVPTVAKVELICRVLADRFGSLKQAKVRKNELAKEYLEVLDSIPLTELAAATYQGFDGVDDGIINDCYRNIQFEKQYVWTQETVEKIRQLQGQIDSMLTTNAAQPVSFQQSYFVELELTSEDNWSISHQFGPLELSATCGERSSAYWWDFKASTKTTRPLKAWLIYIDKMSGDDEFPSDVTMETLLLTGGESFTVYDKCTQGLAIGVTLRGVLMVEIAEQTN